MDKIDFALMVLLVIVAIVTTNTARNSRDAGYESGYADGLSEGRQQEADREIVGWGWEIEERVLLLICREGDFDLVTYADGELSCCNKTDNSLSCDKYSNVIEVRNTLPDNIIISNTGWT